MIVRGNLPYNGTLSKYHAKRPFRFVIFRVLSKTPDWHAGRERGHRWIFAEAARMAECALPQSSSIIPIYV